MYEKEHNRNKVAEDQDEGPEATLALVLRMPIARMPEVCARVNDVPGARIVYQRTSAGRLTIIEERGF
jgi:hypothetical protein